MNEQLKQIGGVWIPETTFTDFKRIAKSNGFRKPTELIAELVKNYVLENSNSKDAEWLTKEELVEHIMIDQSIELSKYSENSLFRKLTEIHSEFDEKDVKGGSGRGDKTLYHVRILNYLRDRNKG